MSVEGEYDSDDSTPLITFGYSKDHRPDLKQFMIYMMSSQDGDVPLLAQTVARNSSDKKLFRERLKALKEQIQQGHEEYIVADSELYTNGNFSADQMDFSSARKAFGCKRARHFYSRSRRD
jgi:transposase